MSIVDITTNTSYATVSDAILGSGSGDIIDLSPGTYSENFPLIDHSLTIEGAGGMAHLTTPATIPANMRAVLFVQGGAGADLTVRNLEISGASDPYGNGAGILFEIGNGNLTIQNSWFHDNQDGVLVGNQPTGTVTIDRSEFNNNGVTDPNDPHYGYAHNLYVNRVASLTVTNSYFHDAIGGHELKSRAAVTVIDNNRIQDNSANASYAIDTPEGGLVTITNNIIEKGADSSNRNTVHFGGEASPSGYSTDPSALTMTGNILINDRAGATGILNQTANPDGLAYPVDITNNTLYNFDVLYQTLQAPIAPGQDTLTNNTLLASGAPSIDTSHPFSVPEPAAPIGLALLAAAMLRRRKRSKQSLF